MSTVTKIFTVALCLFLLACMLLGCNNKASGDNETQQSTRAPAATVSPVEELVFKKKKTAVDGM